MVKSEKQINSFIRGLITEANPLTFPENASLDEDNFVLNRDGSRSRRLGMEYEPDYVLNALGSTTIDSISFHEWRLGGKAGLSIGVLRVYNKLWFMNMLDQSPSTALLNGGNAIEIDFLLNAPISTAVINNAFIVVSADIPYPVRLYYTEETDTVAQEPYKVFVRDFWGVNDGLLENERPTVLSNVHKYNLLNQGWSPIIATTCGTPPIECTYTSKGFYPSNSDIWSLGRNSSTSSADYQEYDPNLLVKNTYDFLAAPKGKHIIDAFDRGASREAVSGVAAALVPVVNPLLTATQVTWGAMIDTAVFFSNQAVPPGSPYPVDTTQDLPIDRETGSFSAVASYSGRVFYSGVRSAVLDPDSKSPNYSGYIFFSQTIVNDEKLGKCYQEADPTSVDISDIVDTDGGTIHIVDAINIIALVPTKSMLLVFAENGVWQISGGQANFSATDYDLTRVSAIGCNSPHSIVAVNNEVFYWAKGGIFRIVFDDTDGGLKSENLSLTSVQTLYNDIPEVGRQYARGVFEEKQNTIRWLYNDDVNYAGVSNYNRELILDLTLGAFYTNTIDNTTVYIADFVRIPDYAESQDVDEVVVGTDIVYVGTDEVQVNITTHSYRESPYSYIAIDPTAYTWTLSKYRDTTFYDWTVTTGGTNYSSYLVTGYEIFGEMMRKKQVPYVLFYFDRTEDGFVEDVNGDLQLANPSSCMVQSQWNWTNSVNSGKWGTAFQAYRLTRNYIPSGPADTFDYGDRVIVSKSRLRGSGRAVSLKIESEEGKDMKLLGWAMSVTGSSAP